ncbi:Hypothetical predicted protein [Octopus vulgaris]|uniref:4-nitrophenylphosphatase-like n=1 Tax=Octopus vulgaris TaxID=6645 RepID=A0AA36AW01_OCTVU|nr:Hypothetical predicted protein [Octopus vulgaris]
MCSTGICTCDPNILLQNELLLCTLLRTGVLWRHLEPIPGASDTVKKLKKLGKNVLFVTNNSTKSRKDYCIKFSQLGFEVKESEIISTAYVAALYLHECNFKGKVYLVGSKGIADELDNFGIQHTEVGD